MSDWCILRTSGRRTVDVAESLGDNGLEVWTPTLRFMRRLPRTRKEVEAFAPIMPQYVFARAHQFDDLLRLEPVHPLFSLYRWRLSDGNWYFPFIDDRELRHLRAEDYRTPKPVPPPKPEPRQYTPGQVVSVPHGLPFAGMSGVVERTKGKFVIVAVGQRDLHVARWKLDEHYRQAA